MSGVLHSLVSVVRARHAKAAQARRPARTRLQVEALEERCLLAWGSLPPPTIAIPTSALAVDLDTQGTATIAGNEVDFYLLDVQSPATYIISAATPASNLDTVLALYDANGLRLAFNDDVSATNLDSSLNRFLQPGIYYFGITKLAGTPGGSYTWSVAEPTIPENNTLATATDLGVLTEPTFRSPLTLVGAAAWVRFTMNGPGTSTDRVAVQALAGADDLQLELTDALGVPLRESIGATNSEEISLDGLPAGTYHVRVYDNDGDADLAFYTLVINPGAAPVVIPLDASGAGTGADTIGLENTEDPFPDVVPIPDVVRFTATVTGRVSILMRADTPLMQSLLSDPSQVSAPASPVIVANQAAVAGQFEGTQDYLIQFDVVAGNTYQLNASVVKEPGQVPHVGDYRLFVSTEPLGSDFSAVTPHEVPLDASGTGLQLGTLETVGDIDLFTFTATVTGRTTVRIDGGAGVNQVVHLLTKPGQRYAVEVSDANDSTGVYALSITSIADDFPDSVVNRIALDAAGSGNVKGTINYAGDEDVFRFTATQTGTITVRMQSRPGIDTFSALISALSVTPIPTASYEISPSRPSTAGEPAFDRIVQFQVVQGEQYTIRASGADGSSGDYLLSLAMAVDDHAGAPRTIDLFPDGLPPAGSITRPPVVQTGTIETPQDQDRFQFSTGNFEGFVIVALEPTAGTSMQGLLTVPSLPPVVATLSDQGPNPDLGWQFMHFGSAPTDGGVLFQAFSESGWEEESRSAFLGFYVKQNQTYEFLVSGNQTTIGEYRLTFGAYRAPDGDAQFYGFGDTFLTRSFTRIPGVDAFSINTRFLQFSLTNDGAPSIDVDKTGIAPVRETGKTPNATNTQLAVFSLPPANPGTTGVTVPNGPATAAGNSLLTTLLTVAARDNAVRPTESTVATRGTTELISTLLASVLVGVASSGGSDAAAAAPAISGTVFADVDANGRPAEEEPGVAGEQVVLEVLQNGQYVVVATATTDANGAYAFEAVPAGEYRVRRVTEGTAGKANGQTIKITGDGKPQTLNFGKPMKRGKVLDHRVHPPIASAVDEVVPFRESTWADAIDRVFQEWDQYGSSLVLLDTDEDDAVATVSLGLFCLTPIALVSLASTRRGCAADTDRRAGASGPQTT